MKNTKGFNLLSVIIIITVTSIISGITTGVIVTNSYKNNTGISYDELLNDENLNEFLEVYSSVVNNYYEEVDTREMVDTALDAMLDYLGDTYTTYLDSSETEALEERLAGSYRGIGITILGREIQSVTNNSPAANAGLEVGDIIINVDGTDVSETDGSVISEMIKKTDKDSVTLTVLRNDSELTFNINIGTVPTVAVAYRMFENNVGYLEMQVFSETLSSQVESALADLESQGMQKLIIDLRDNTGGYLESAEATANLFLENGKLIYSLENKDSKADYYDKTSTSTNYPIVILTNGNTASASEILAAALEDSYSNSVIFVGKTSFGKGLVQQTYDLSDGSMAKYTSARWLRPNGECINGIGLSPDYDVDFSYIYNEAGEVISDTQLQKALEVINAL